MTVDDRALTIQLSVSSNTLSLQSSGENTPFTTSQTITLTVNLQDSSGQEISLDSTSVTWTVPSSSVSVLVWFRDRSAQNGRAWGKSHPDNGELSSGLVPETRRPQKKRLLLRISWEFGQ